MDSIYESKKAKNGSLFAVGFLFGKVDKECSDEDASTFYLTLLRHVPKKYIDAFNNERASEGVAK